jgi:chromatin remodeling complex protein RSC6
MLQLDDKLSELLGVQELPRTGLPEAVGKLLKPLEPLTFTHTIEWVS